MRLGLKLFVMANRVMPPGEAPESEEIDDGGEDEAAEVPVTVTAEREPIAATTERAFSDRQEPPPSSPAPVPEPDHPRAVPVVTPPAAGRPPEPGPDDQ